MGAAPYSFSLEDSVHEKEGSVKLEEGQSPPSSDSDIADESTPTEQPNAHRYVTGWRLFCLLFGVSLAIFLANLEVTIVSTSLISITNDLNGFSRTGWVVVAYLITYTGFIIVWAKLSDILGRKVSINAALLIFVVTSALCGSAQSMTALIVFRSLQGIGAAGCFSVSMVIFFEMIPKEKYAKYGSILSADVALATALGPIFGGLIVDGTTWRWVFLLNVPGGLLATAILVFLIPSGFPHHWKPKSEQSKARIFSMECVERVDFLGSLLLIGANLLLVTALLEASTTYSWSSGVTIALIVLSAVLWVLFAGWEWFATKDTVKQEPVFPFRFFFNRAWMGMLINSVLLGVPFTVIVVDLPQRFQAINGVSALNAGVRLLPYALFAPLGSLLSNIIFAKKRLPLTLLLAGATFQFLGLILLATLPEKPDLPNSLYGFLVIAGLGVGLTFGTLVVITPESVEPRDLATATGAMIQSRQMGSAIGMTIGSSILNSYLKSNLRHVLSASQLEALLQTTAVVKTFPAELQLPVKQTFAEGYSLQMKVVAGIAAAEFLAVAMMVKLKHRK
ncbi:MFS general substrate transporter [Lindgomyces ingoldianus]|uniref:MFS general substrate transporter n=1 Tax=Lindgomyces ingoldianus TaxID=673940 RepID=A0ACB6QNL6_9PLEO|nr:MFS general substrate transporter [Lindgomyces ingoldianus]KAF2468467.1 MFS general substrate transporter [Lindgomyces ingoldianus]